VTVKNTATLRKGIDAKVLRSGAWLIGGTGLEELHIYAWRIARRHGMGNWGLLRYAIGKKVQPFIDDLFGVGPKTGQTPTDKDHR
jgi:hypothetical protein